MMATPLSSVLLRPSDALRRSLPDLATGPGPASVPGPAHPSSAPRCVRSSRSSDWSVGVTRRRPSGEIRPLSFIRPADAALLTFDPSPVVLQNRVHSVDNVASLPKAAAYISPTIRGSSSSAPSTPRSSLPRPAPSATGSTPRYRLNQSACR